MRKNERGQTVLEYILVVAALGVIVLTATKAMHEAFWKQPDGLVESPRNELAVDHFSNGEW